MSKTNPDLIDLFTQRLTAVGGQVQHVSDCDAAAQAIRTIAATVGDDIAWIPDDFASRARGLLHTLLEVGLTTRVPVSAAEVRDQPLGLAIAAHAIAETGSVILIEPHVPSRAVTLMTETLVIACSTEDIVPSLDETAPILRATSANGAAYATFITGPSRTADIERQLTVGVQGPGVYHVILIDSLT